MRPFQTLLRDFPAITRAALLLAALNTATFVGVRLFLRDGRPAIYLLGDSCIGNYRMDPGERLQDFLQRMEPESHVMNWAEPGASPLDYLLQSCKGRLLGDKPYRIVLAMAPDKLMGDSTNRLDEDGANLRWIPLDRTGKLIWNALTPRERNVAVVQKTSLLLYGFTDLGRALWIRYWQWPQQRHDMRHASSNRRQKIEQKVEDIGKSLATTPIGTAKDFAAQLRARDTRLLFDVLRSQGIEPLVVIHPYGNPCLLKRHFSPLALAKRDTIDQRLRSWLDSQRVAYLDLDAPGELRNFPDSAWDDNAHLKSARAFHYLSQRTALWLSEHRDAPLAEASSHDATFLHKASHVHP